MKNKIVYALCALTLLLTLSGCGESNTPATSSDANAVVEAENTTDDNNNSNESESESADQTNSSASAAEILELTDVFLPEELKKPHDFVYKEVIYFDEYEKDAGSYTLVYIMDVDSNNQATLSHFSLYDSNRYDSSSYIGTVTEDNDDILFISTPIHPEKEDGGNNYIFTTENGKVTNVEYVYAETGLRKLQGIYTCPSSEYGPLKLEITQIGQINLTMENGKTYKGSMIVVDGKNDLMVSDDQDEIYIDWFIYLSGTTFSYEPYYYADYSSFAGNYTAFGGLGNIDFTVDEDGNVCSDILIDGQSMHFTGSLYIDSDTNQMTGTYLTSEEGYTLDLTLMDIGGDDGLNYSGYLTSPLAAG